MCRSCGHTQNGRAPKPAAKQEQASPPHTPPRKTAAAGIGEKEEASPAKAFVQCLASQLEAVEACVKVAQGAHLEVQTAARNSLQRELELARSAHRAADPSARRALVQKQLAEVSTKITSNRDLLAKAQLEVARYEGYVQSQTAKQTELEAELRSIASAEAVGGGGLAPLDDAHAKLLDQLAQIQGQLAEYAKSKSASQPSAAAACLPLQLALPEMPDLDMLDDGIIDTILGLEDQAMDASSIKRRSEAREALAAKKKKATGSCGVHKAALKQ